MLWNSNSDHKNKKFRVLDVFRENFRVFNTLNPFIYTCYFHMFYFIFENVLLEHQIFLISTYKLLNVKSS